MQGPLPPKVACLAPESDAIRPQATAPVKMAVNMQTNSTISIQPTNMRKRKRGYGEYVDEDTGEITIVQTTKQAKRNHQKSGKWYKEPTEQEIRAWEREEAKQAAAERVTRREENKKLNAAKRAEQEAKEQEAKRRMFEAGKITFTQTLAKKDEDQLNLHSWFGGRPQQPKSKKPVLKAIEYNANKDLSEDKEDNANGRAEHRLTKLVRSLSHESIDDRDIEADREFFEENKTTTTYKDNTRAMADPQPKDTTMDQAVDLDQAELDLLNSSQDFDIAEDSDADTEVLDPEPEQVEQDSYNAFKVPPLPEPKRLPFSPVSQSELNVRATQALQVSSFKGRLAKADITTTSSTQAVRDILSGLSTQDLALDLEDDDLDKENDEPETELSADKLGSPVKKSSPLKQVETMKPIPQTQSFTSINDSFDYDDMFAELDHNNNPSEDDATEPEDFDDGDLDDDFLSKLPLTQMVSSARTPAPVSIPSTLTKPEPKSAPTKPIKEPFQKYDSFAVEGLDDDDLLEGLEEYERSQNKALTPATLPRKKRVLPWEKEGWKAGITGAVEGDEGQSERGPQDTEVL